jgi:hypothetical protein
VVARRFHRPGHAWLRRHLPSLLEAAAVDAALLPEEATPGPQARRFVGSLAGALLGNQPGADAGAGTPWPPQPPTTRFAGSAGTMRFCM